MFSDQDKRLSSVLGTWDGNPISACLVEKFLRGQVHELPLQLAVNVFNGNERMAVKSTVSIEDARPVFAMTKELIGSGMVHADNLLLEVLKSGMTARQRRERSKNKAVFPDVQPFGTKWNLLSSRLSRMDNEVSDKFEVLLQDSSRRQISAFVSAEKHQSSK